MPSDTFWRNHLFATELFFILILVGMHSPLLGWGHGISCRPEHMTSLYVYTSDPGSSISLLSSWLSCLGHVTPFDLQLLLYLCQPNSGAHFKRGDYTYVMISGCLHWPVYPMSKRGGQIWNNGKSLISDNVINCYRELRACLEAISLWSIVIQISGSSILAFLQIFPDPYKKEIHVQHLLRIDTKINKRETWSLLAKASQGKAGSPWLLDCLVSRGCPECTPFLFPSLIDI